MVDKKNAYKSNQVSAPVIQEEPTVVVAPTEPAFVAPEEPVKAPEVVDVQIAAPLIEKVEEVP